MGLGLKDLVALVAPASRGIGYAAALELAREGARLFLCSREKAPDSTVTEREDELAAVFSLFSARPTSPA